MTLPFPPDSIPYRADTTYHLTEPIKPLRKKPSLKYGLPYGWWKNKEVWAEVHAYFWFFMFVLFMFAVLYGWFADVKPSEVGF